MQELQELDPNKRFHVFRNESVDKRVDRFLSAPKDSWMSEEDIAIFLGVSLEELQDFLSKHPEIQPAGYVPIEEED